MFTNCALEAQAGRRGAKEGFGRCAALGGITSPGCQGSQLEWTSLLLLHSNMQNAYSIMGASEGMGIYFNRNILFWI